MRASGLDAVENRHGFAGNMTIQMYIIRYFLMLSSRKPNLKMCTRKSFGLVQQSRLTFSASRAILQNVKQFSRKEAGA